MEEKKGFWSSLREELPAHQQKPNYILGVIFTICAFALIAISGACVKYLQGRVSVVEIVWLQNAISIFLLLPALFLDQKFEIKTNTLAFQCISALGGVASVFLVYLAIRHIPLASAILLNNTAPLFFPLVVWAFLRYKVPKKMWWGIGIGFIGVVVILHPTADAFEFGNLIGLASGFSLSIGLVAMRRLTYTESSRRILFYNFLVCVIILAPFAFTSWATPLFEDWPILILIGFLIFWMNSFLILSYRYAKPHSVAPFNYFGVVFAGFLDWWLWGVVPSLLTMIGIIIVSIGAITTLILQVKDENTKEKQPPIDHKAP